MSNKSVDEQTHRVSVVECSLPAITKKPYTPPILIKWGSLTNITRSVGQQGAHDGGKGRYHGTN
jgi:hypothetical protein